MQVRWLRLLLALVVAPTLSGGDAGDFKVAGLRFSAPRAGELVDRGDFVLSGLPSYRSVVAITLDGEPLPGGAWSESATAAQGVLRGVAPGPHERAEITLTILFGGIPIRVSTSRSFEMAAARTRLRRRRPG